MRRQPGAQGDRQYAGIFTKQWRLISLFVSACMVAAIHEHGKTDGVHIHLVLFDFYSVCIYYIYYQKQMPFLKDFFFGGRS